MKVVKRKRYESSIHIGLILYLFMFLFAPPLIRGINMGIIVAALSLIFLLFHFKQTVRLFLKAQMKGWVIGEVSYLLYMLIIASIYYIMGEGTNINNYIVNIYQVFLIIPVTMLGVLTILLYCKKKHINFDSLLKHFIIAGLIQASMTIGAFLLPEVKQLFVTIMLNNTGDEILSRPFLVNLRFFGFANSMLDAFGVGTGILAALPFYIKSYDKKKYLLSVPALITVPLLNARTGLVIFIVGIFASFIKRTYSLKEIIRIMIIILMFPIIAVALLKILNIYYPGTYQWIIRDFSSFLGKNYQNKYTTSANLFSKSFWTFPKFPGFIFGTGHTIYQAEGYVHSDVGYVNKIWNVGILGTLFQYGIYVMYFYYANRKKIDSRQKLLLNFFFLTFFIYEIKGNMLTYTPGLTIIMTCIFYIISDECEYVVYLQKIGLRGCA